MDSNFAAGLRELAESAFPKNCRNCGRAYGTAREFIEETQPVRAGETGLKQGYGEGDLAIVELFRNCVCGSTLMDVFSDRRDLSAAGERRRSQFDKLLPNLQQKGLGRAQARDYLLQVLRGGRPA
jgi:hypothetical protein